MSWAIDRDEHVSIYTVIKEGAKLKETVFFVGKGDEEIVMGNSGEEDIDSDEEDLDEDRFCGDDSYEDNSNRDDSSEDADSEEDSEKDDGRKEKDNDAILVSTLRNSLVSLQSTTLHNLGLKSQTR
jgi:hypothetical protein